MTAPIICEAFTHQVQILQHFQSRWKQEYLTSLTEFYKVKGTCAPKQFRVEMFSSYMMAYPGVVGRWQ